jgi:Tfp pilus assembly protein PilN
MPKSIATYLNPLCKKQIVAVHLVARPEGVFDAYWVEVKLRKNNAVPSGFGQWQGKLAELAKKLSGNSACVLSIEGVGIITKGYETSDHSTENLVYNLVPRDSADEFYHQTIVGNTEAFLTVSRKALIQDILSVFEKEGIFILDVNLGVCSMEVLAQLYHEERTFHTSTTMLTVKEGKFHRIERQESASGENYLIGDSNIPGTHLPAFANGITFVNKQGTEQSYFQSVAQTRKSYKFKQLCQWVGIVALSVFFAALLINYLVYSNINDNNTSKSIEYESGLKVVNTMQAMSAELAEKETLIKKIGMDKRQQHSFIYDRIAASMPSSITLTQMKVNPSKRKDRGKRTPEFTENQIEIQGEIQNAAILYQWIDKLYGMDWVSDVELKEIKQEDINQAAHFVVQVNFKL